MNKDNYLTIYKGQEAISKGQLARGKRQKAKSNLLIAYCLLTIAYCTRCILHVAYCTLPFANRKLHIAYCTLPFACCLLLIVNPQNAKSQQKITLENAIQTALNNNLSVKSDKLKAEYQQLMIKTAKQIPATAFSSELGQLNSAYFDNRFGVSQSFALPLVYKNEKNLLSEESKTSLFSVAIKEVELKKMVSETFYHLLYLNDKEQLLLKNDTIFTRFLEKATLRLNKGESNILEKSSAEMQLGNLRWQLKQLLQEKAFLKIQFQLMLNTDIDVEPKANAFKMAMNVNESNRIVEHPTLKILQQQKQVNIAAIEVEKSKLLPQFNVGYNSMTMRGVGANDVTYNGFTRFHAAQIGVGIPLFRNAQRAKIEASKHWEKVIDNDYQTEKQKLDKQYQNALLQYQSSLENITYFEEKALPNANLIEKIANQQFQNGEINYLDWVMLINQSLTIKSNYLDAIKAINEHIILINYLNNK